MSPNQRLGKDEVKAAMKRGSARKQILSDKDVKAMVGKSKK